MNAQAMRDGWWAGSREQALATLAQGGEEPWDLIVIGGGITGAGILREAARRGLRCLLVERQDFAWGTSSRSSKMVHGGLRYLGSGQLGLTRDSVRERQRLLDEAPGLVDVLHFFMPHYKGQFPGPRLFGMVLSVYDRLAGQRNHEFYRPADTAQWMPGLRQDGLLGGTRFADAVTDDARLVMRVLDEARGDGALAFNYLAATALRTTEGRVSGVRLVDQLTLHSYEVRARVVVSATGAWTDQLRAELGAEAAIRPLRGSHLVFPFWRLPVACTLSFFHPRDRRPVFIFPWEGTTVVGTTDLDHAEDLNREAAITEQEVGYLLEAVAYALPGSALTRADIQCTWAGVRPVVGGSASDPSKEKREHAIWDDQGLISVAGGKLTTFRLIALDVLKVAATYLPQAAAEGSPQVFRPVEMPPRPALVSAAQWRRLCGHYGTRVREMLDLPLQSVTGSDTLWAELAWAASHESVQHLDDLLLRRTRLGLLLPEGAQDLQTRLRALVQTRLGWTDAHWDAEWARYVRLWQRHYSVPTVQADTPVTAQVEHTV